MEAVNRLLTKVSARQDLVFVLLFALVVAMLVVPLPTIFVDVLLAINILLSIIILLVAIYLRNVLELSTFPSIILVSTIFRLALTVSTTRLILAQGDAGKIIAAFGDFVVGGNLVVGLTVFLIVAIVQFMVVTKGAERIAEVSARFTLDALPGKQMAIDADLRSGEITQADAKKQRFRLDKESQFFGSMDGAMRFVKGDAIASLIIVFVNLFGGILIGTLQNGMPFRDAMKLYSLLTVGDGLVAQIPSMLIAVAAGAVVTRVVTEESVDLGQDIGRQLTAEPKSLAIAAVISVALALVPGFPTAVFLALGVLLGALAWLLLRRNATATSEAAAKALRDAEPVPEKPIEFSDAPIGAVFSLSGPLALHELMNSKGAALAKAMETELGHQAFVYGFPMRRLGFRIRNDLEGLHVLMEGRSVATIDDPFDRDGEVVAQDIWEAMQPYISRMFDAEIAVDWMTSTKDMFPRAIADIDQSVRALFVVDVIRDLLEDGHTLSQPRPILEALMRAKDVGMSAPAVAEMARSQLRYGLVRTHVAKDGKLPTFFLEPAMEMALRQQAQRLAEAPLIVARDPFLASGLAQLREKLKPAMSAGDRPVLVCQAEVRRLARALLRVADIGIPVVAMNDVDPAIAMRSLGSVGGEVPA
ncbi:MAG: FHIPEP family type III secretion protein [Beijerinckiaceae bacterium]